MDIKVKLTLKGKTFELTRDEAKELRDILGEVVGAKPGIVEKIIHDYPWEYRKVNPQPYWNTPVWTGDYTVTCDNTVLCSISDGS